MIPTKFMPFRLPDCVPVKLQVLLTLKPTKVSVPPPPLRTPLSPALAVISVKVSAPGPPVRFSKETKLTAPPCPR